LLCCKEKHEKANNTGYKKTCLLHYEMLISYHYAVYDLVLSANAKPSLFTPKNNKAQTCHPEHRLMTGLGLMLYIFPSAIHSPITSCRKHEEDSRW